MEFLAARERGERVSAEDIMADGFRYATSADDVAAEDEADEQPVAEEPPADDAESEMRPEAAME